MEQLSKSMEALAKIARLEEVGFAKLISISDRVRKIREEELSRMPLHINVITISAVGRLKETAHSAILQQLLMKQEILNSFLKDVAGIDNSGIKVSDVRPAEQDRIDVSIYGDNLCVIVENKVNDAVEQSGQIFRYVQSALNAGYKPGQIKVVYLNSNHHSPPTEYSLTEDGAGKQGIPSEVKENMVIKDYCCDIYQWVKGLFEVIPESEYYLRSALCQYQDYLEEYFYITDKFEPMKKRIREVIHSEILKGLSDDDDADFSKRQSALDEAVEDLQQLLEGINALKSELAVRQDAVNIQKELDKDGLSLSNLEKDGYGPDRFGVKMSINGKPGFLAYGYSGNDTYIGYAFDTPSLAELEKNNLIQLFEQLGKRNGGETSLWPCWSYIEKTTLVNEYVNFVRFIKERATEEGKFQISFE